MSRLAENIPTNDPLMDTEKRAVIDKILIENKGKDGAIMVALNELQSQIGYITEPMEEYAARKLSVPISAVHGVTTFLFIFYQSTTRQAHHQILPGDGLLCRRHPTIDRQSEANVRH